MAVQRPRLVPRAPAKPRFLWWRFATLALTLTLLGWGFSAAWLCRPAPTPAQQAVFFLALLLILTQTAQAGWLRHDDPWELKALRYAAEVLVALFAVIFVLFLIVFVTSLVDDPVLKFVLGLVMAALIIWMLTLVLNKE